MIITVVEGYNIHEDIQQVEDELASLESLIESLESRGISVPESKKLVDQVKQMSINDPDQALEALSVLQEARQYLNYAGATRIPKPKGPSMFNILIGILAIGGGIVALLMVFKHEDHPHHQEKPAPRQFGYKQGGRPVYTKKQSPRSPAEMFK